MRIAVVRKNGSDGVVTVDYETKEIDSTSHTATAGVDFEAGKGTLKFQHGETEDYIVVKILQHEDPDEQRDESFAVHLSNVTPAGDKLSKRAMQIVNIVTDVENKKKQDALAQLLQKIEDEEEITWT